MTHSELSAPTARSIIAKDKGWKISAGFRENEGPNHIREIDIDAICGERPASPEKRGGPVLPLSLSSNGDTKGNTKPPQNVEFEKVIPRALTLRIVEGTVFSKTATLVETVAKPSTESLSESCRRTLRPNDEDLKRMPRFIVAQSNAYAKTFEMAELICQTGFPRITHEQLNKDRRAAQNALGLAPDDEDFDEETSNVQPGTPYDRMVSYKLPLIYVYKVQRKFHIMENSLSSLNYFDLVWMRRESLMEVIRGISDQTIAKFEVDALYNSDTPNIVNSLRNSILNLESAQRISPPAEAKDAEEILKKIRWGVKPTCVWGDDVGWAP